MNDKYDFLKEQVKKQKPYMKWLRRAGVSAFSGLIFSLVVLVVMVFVYPRVNAAVNPKKTPQVDLGVSSSEKDSAQTTDSKEENQTASSTVASETAESEMPDTPEQKEDSPESSVLPETGEEASSSVVPQEKEEEVTTAENLEKLSRDVSDIVNTLEKSMVTVIGVTEDKDWFNQTYENQGQLSGLIVAFQNGAYYILTEYRVVKDVNRIMVTFADGNTTDARFVKSDTATGLAVIRVDADDVSKDTRQAIAPVEIKKYTSVKQGDAVIAIGSPMGYSNGMAVGMVTSVDNFRSVTDNAYHILCTDIPVSEDGSGILVNMDGCVVGLMAQQLLDTKDLKLMMCLPFTELVAPIEKLCNNEEMAYVGINGQDVTSTISEKTGIPKGIWIDSVDKASPAMETGIQAGDVIVRLNDTEVSTMKTFHNVLNQNKVGDKITIQVMRRSVEGYVEVEFKVTLTGR